MGKALCGSDGGSGGNSAAVIGSVCSGANGNVWNGNDGSDWDDGIGNTVGCIDGVLDGSCALLQYDEEGAIADDIVDFCVNNELVKSRGNKPFKLLLGISILLIGILLFESRIALRAL